MPEIFGSDAPLSDKRKAHKTGHWTLDNPQLQGCRQKRKMSRKSHKMSQKPRKNGSKATFSVDS
ncbi:MAG: hypothetical protein K8R77_01120, partial [Anaerolineaceae bacterium]|nr:hypothetical protein [Anaerolineaceae bacterium]